MNNEELIKKITQKKEFSQLPEKDIEMAFEKFNKEHLTDEEKIKKTRDLLRKVFSGFTSQKLLSLKDKDADWILRKHLSTRERISNYEEIYRRILKRAGKKVSIVDLGAGVNGFSHKYFGKVGFIVNYVAVEAMGQLVTLMNNYFTQHKVKARAIHLSLFQLKRLKELIKKQKKPRVVFIFKVIDALETIERDYSKKLIMEISSLADEIVLSFSTESMIKRKKFMVKRSWILNFIGENFVILDNFSLGGEKFIIFTKKKNL